MSTLLPVLYSQPPQMSLCSICPEPGRCCKQFCLPSAPSFWEKSWREDAQKWLDENELPYAPHSRSQHACTDPETGDEYVLVWFGCNHVTPDGRCGIYETRPDTCRIFVPASDPLCAFHPNAAYAFTQDPVTNWHGVVPD